MFLSYAPTPVQAAHVFAKCFLRASRNQRIVMVKELLIVSKDLLLYLTAMMIAEEDMMEDRQEEERAKAEAGDKHREAHGDQQLEGILGAVDLPKDPKDE